MKSLLCRSALFFMLSTSCFASSEQEPSSTHEAPVSTEKLAIMPIKFDDHTSVSEAVIAECKVAEKINSAIESNSHDYGYDIEVVETEDQLKKYQQYVAVKIYSIDANEWRFPSFRPSSIMSMGVEVYRDGSLVRRVTKNLRSSVSLTACERLEKVANTAGIFIKKWSSKVLKM